MAVKGAAPSKLIGAIRSSQPEAVKAALAEGADIEEADLYGCTGLPLRTACFVGNPAIVRELLRHGADLNAPGGDGPGAPLRLALRCKHDDLVTLLLASGAQIPPGIIIPAEMMPQAEASKPKIDTPPLEFDFPEKPSVKPNVEVSQPEVAAMPFPGAAPDILLDTFEPEALEAKQQEAAPVAPPSGPVFPEGHVIEEVDVSACYGTDTNLLGLDLLKMNEEAERANTAPPPPEPKSFWTTSRKKV